MVLRNHGAADLRLKTSKAGNRTLVERKSMYENNEMDEGRTKKKNIQRIFSVLILQDRISLFSFKYESCGDVGR